MKIGFLACFAIAYASWLFFNLSFGPQALALGVPVALIAAAIASRFLFRELEPGQLSPLKIAWLAVFLADFALRGMKANLSMARIILTPNAELSPAVLRLPLRTGSEFVAAGVGNAITLMPGTLTVDADPGFLYVHCISAKELDAEKAKEKIVGGFERGLKRIFE